MLKTGLQHCIEYEKRAYGMLTTSSIVDVGILLNGCHEI